ncbi:MAG TPA: flagellin [Hyphomicrobiaceae bacterium]|nr:flagellin [Hyphomicrobiaceae bacterium]
MALNVISNYAANVAHRNLTASDSAATSSLSKLSAGSRVITAKDDAASMAIGNRMNVEVNALKQANVNAGQAVSMLQIADGAMSKVQDILVRMKTLAVQSGSGQLSGTERGMLNTEYQALVQEIDRIAQDTEFNGNQLINGSITIGDNGSFGAAAGVVNLAVTGVNTDAATTAGNLGYSTGANGGTFTLTATDAGLGSAVTYTATIASGDLTGGYLTTGTSLKLTSATPGAEGFATITLNTSFKGDTTIATDGFSFSTADTSTYSFKIGSGTATYDNISITVNAANTAALGLNNTDVTSQGNADAASKAISNAIDTLNTARANVGASQNRLEFAAANLSTSVENQEAARSSLLDLDIAAEMTKFTSKQILVQAGVSMLAQANQMPQNLMRLFQ